jgi:hypothetical protein
MILFLAASSNDHFVVVVVLVLPRLVQFDGWRNFSIFVLRNNATFVQSRNLSNTKLITQRINRNNGQSRNFCR